MKQKELALWLRAVVVLCAVGSLVLAGVVSMRLSIAYLNSYLLENVPPRWLMGVVWASMIPMLWFLALIWQIAGEIGRDNSFCLKNAQRLKVCSYLALTDTVLYAVSLVIMALRNELTIRVLAMTVLLLAMGVAVAVCCAALSHLTRKAAILQDENDLTI